MKANGPAADDVVAVDVGGTFTDLTAVIDGRLVAHKVPSTPSRPEEAVLIAMREVGSLGCSLVHGSTVATNAVLERRGARTAFVATRGFSDIIEIGRQERSGLYDLFVPRPSPLVPRNLRFEAPERIGAGGHVISRLTRKASQEIARAVSEKGARSAAVCLLFSFENPAHEKILAEELEKRGIFVSLSSSVLPEYREYERASTTVVNAYLSPVIEGYLDRLQDSLPHPGGSSLRLMHSAGGTIDAGTARRRAVDLVLSGPAAGVVAARYLGDALGIENLVSFDMGGTSTDISLSAGTLTSSRGTRVGGLPVALPVIDIHTIGSGGGSLLTVDAAGSMRVGPRSAGADPGPACYGRGKVPTITDAHVVLGRIEPGHFLGGRMAIDPARSEEAIASLGPVDALQAASVAIEVALSRMEAALKKVSLERGHDPRDFSLVAFGGAGPLHACELADRLQMPRVLIPPYPGLFSSAGMLLADAGRDYSRTVLQLLGDAPEAKLEPAFERMEEKARLDMAGEGFETENLRMGWGLDMRYLGQSHEVQVPWRRGSAEGMLSRFEMAYLAEFGYLRHGEPVEVVNIRLTCRAPGPKPDIFPEPPAGESASPLDRREAWLGEPMEVDVYDRWSIPLAAAIDGPALVLQDDTTTVIPPGWRAVTDSMGNLELWRDR